MPKMYMDTKPKARMTPYAFFVNISREEHKDNFPGETVIPAEFSRKCAERWKTLTDKEKKRFHDMAEKDRKRYEAEMRKYMPNRSRGRRRVRAAKDPKAPKRSLSAFFWFCSEERGKIKEQNPHFGVGDVAKELGRMWSEVTPEEKSRFEDMAEQDKERYFRDMAVYKEANAPQQEQEQEQEQVEGEDEYDHSQEQDEEMMEHEVEVIQLEPGDILEVGEDGEELEIEGAQLIEVIQVHEGEDSQELENDDGQEHEQQEELQEEHEEEQQQEVEDGDGQDYEQEQEDQESQEDEEQELNHEEENHEEEIEEEEEEIPHIIIDESSDSE